MLHDKFRKQFAVVKSLNSLKCKGVMVEEILDALIRKYKLYARVVNEGCSNDGIGFVESVRTGRKDKSVGYYYGACSWGGIPTADVGCSSQAVWLKVREALREQDLIR